MLFFISLLPAALLFICGYLIKYKKMAFLISGYNTSSKKEQDCYNKDALCNGVGNFIFILSFITLIPAIFGFLFPNNLNFIILFTVVLSIIATVIGIIYMNTGNRYKK